jgi:hypothetical protein
VRLISASFDASMELGPLIEVLRSDRRLPKRAKLLSMGAEGGSIEARRRPVHLATPAQDLEGLDLLARRPSACA